MYGKLFPAFKSPSQAQVEVMNAFFSDMAQENFRERLNVLTDLEIGEQIRIGYQKYRVIYVEEEYATCVECGGEGNQIVIGANKTHLIRRRPPLLREIEQSTRGSNDSR